MGSLYLGGPTIQEVDGKMKMGLSIYGVAVISGSLYSRFYGIYIYIYIHVCICKLINHIMDGRMTLLVIQCHGSYTCRCSMHS